MRTLKNFQKIVEKGGGESHSAEKIGNLLLRNACKKISAYAPVRNETSGLKSKHLTTRPRTPELCDLRTEMRELSRGKKHPHFPITLAYRKCKHS